MKDATTIINKKINKLEKIILNKNFESIFEYTIIKDQIELLEEILEEILE